MFLVRIRTRVLLLTVASHEGRGGVPRRLPVAGHGLRRVLVPRAVEEGPPVRALVLELGLVGPRHRLVEGLLSERARLVGVEVAADGGVEVGAAAADGALDAGGGVVGVEVDVEADDAHAHRVERDLLIDGVDLGASRSGYRPRRVDL